MVQICVPWALILDTGSPLTLSSLNLQLSSSSTTSRELLSQFSTWINYLFHFPAERYFFNTLPQANIYFSLCVDIFILISIDFLSVYEIWIPNYV